ncbi:hypothetical protein N7478_002084 [Penicillium angulare]|uniref:uncharacterized protein n=1 Tax=Penicillium angulare TaxID=116970 RepID=UPI00253FC502|nr:uncharacterized protein N7478_002084 [Penicillium angulare]KAJ5289054.1 hypothetical protein N7478_002084 [Penicillium angulare]
MSPPVPILVIPSFKAIIKAIAVTIVVLTVLVVAAYFEGHVISFLGILKKIIEAAAPVVKDTLQKGKSRGLAGYAIVCTAYS